MNYWFVYHYNIARHFDSSGFCVETYPYISKEGFYWEAYHDASEYYQHYLYAFRFQNWDLYSYQPWPLSGYVYGPLFAFFLVFISYFVQFFNPHWPMPRVAWESVKVTPMIFDSITTIFVYLIIKNRFENESDKNKWRAHLYGIFGALAFLVMPLVFFYNDVLYLNAYMFTCFNIIALYFMDKRNYRLAGAFLIIAILTKIVALFFLPLWLVFLLRTDKKGFLEFTYSAFITFFALSLPWLLIFQERYFAQQLWPGEPFNTHFSIDRVWILWSTTPFHAFLFWDQGQYGFWYNLALLYYNLNNFYVPMLLFHAICNLTMLLIGPYLYKHPKDFLSYQAMFAIGLHLFLSRGNYKYYDPFFIPFIVIALFVWSSKSKYEFQAVGTIILSMTWLFIVNIWILVKIKWLHMFYVFLLFVTILATFTPEMHLCFFRLRNYRELFAFLSELYRDVVNWLNKLLGLAVNNKLANMIRKHKSS